ncbi:hypothetical protein C3432_04010 [Citrobacter amalonaticus]|uniref:Uncharacterized protein n=1 Tax=Citrobacter amalonaticus TaxID=35703 RepID=A0A2S4S3N5_CITAM|nr:hypothetical protein [Citrobacter amalonaticus]POT59880.1 hypothetical protein C3432_04010 [Citrobacter amalonaticus]POT78011.1 hypothetical protein C3436_11680 [Citrobacter amalonaticus]POU68463.1 hypothetical protein C3430_05215 [Citrobacter amalonaticus]POV08066.1 hypothetical protein C3424_05225 [Citrobacter amalonaticus]
MNDIAFKFKFFLFVWLIPYYSFASTSWSAKSAQMQCGPALVTISAECQVNQRSSTENICKSYQLEIKNGTHDKLFPVPYIPNDQKILLEKQGYSFNDVVKPGDWAPSTMKCYDNESVVIGYHLGLDEEESVKGSLLSYIDAPFIDLSGNFITGNKLSELRAREIKNPYDNTNIEFIRNR